MASRVVYRFGSTLESKPSYHLEALLSRSLACRDAAGICILCAEDSDSREADKLGVYEGRQLSINHQQSRKYQPSLCSAFAHAHEPSPVLGCGRAALRERCQHAP